MREESVLPVAAGSARQTLARSLRALRSHTIWLLLICAALLPLAWGHLGRLPPLMGLAGLAVYTGWCIISGVPSRYRAQAVTASTVVLLYICGALASAKPESLTSVDFANHTGFHAGLAESFLQGKLSLPVEPAPALLRSKNPYAPERPFPFVWDASYYQGKYYLYFGPAPVLTLYLPFRIVAQRALPSPFALLIFLTAGFIGSLCVLERARMVCGLRRPSAAIQVLSALLLGLASLAPIMQRRPSVYEVAIASAYCFFMWGVYALLGQLRYGHGPRDSREALLASLLLGLSAGSRPTFAASGLLLGIAAVAQVSRHWRIERWAVLQRSLALIAPFAVCMFLLGLYNKLRFDVWTEFGLRYQLNHLDLVNMRFTADKVLRGLAYFLFSSPTHANQFPPIRVDHTTQPFGYGRHPTIHEGVLGLFPTMPVAMILFAVPLLVLRRDNRRFTLVAAVLIGYAVLMLLSVSAAGVSPRYEMDFVPTLLVVGTLTFYAILSIRWRSVAFAAEMFWVPAVLYSVTLGVLAALGDEATPDSLKARYPAVFALLRLLFWP